MPDFPDRPGYSFDPGPPPEASRFLMNKGLKPSFAWEDVEPEEHAVAFTVAKAMQLDVLEDIRAEVQRALDEGRTLEQFKRDLKPKLVAAGWWGRKQMTDPVTGEVGEVQLGSPRRLKTIYDSNLRSARAAGQWERIQRTKRAMPYLVYELGPSERHRADHAAKRGLVLPADDPFWDTWFPPNGWGCKCRVRQIGRREAERLGIREAPRVEERPWRNPRTGEVRMVPRGIDPAWTGNPGANRMQRMEQMLAGKLDAAAPELARVITRDIATSWRAERVLQDAADGAVPVGMLPAEIADAVGSPTRVVQMTSSYGDKFEALGRDITTATLAALDEALREGRVAVQREDGRTNLVVFGDKWRFVLKVLPNAGEVWINTMHRAEPRHWRQMIKRAGVTILRE